MGPRDPRGGRWLVLIRLQLGLTRAGASQGLRAACGSGSRAGPQGLRAPPPGVAGGPETPFIPFSTDKERVAAKLFSE